MKTDQIIEDIENLCATYSRLRLTERNHNNLSGMFHVEQSAKCGVEANSIKTCIKALAENL